MPSRLASGSSATNASSSVRASVRALSAAGVSKASILPRIHRDQPVEALGLVEVGGGHQHAHVRPARADARRSAPRTGGATADRRRWSARPGSADRDRGSARSTGRASASCRRRACRPAGRETAPGRLRAAARRCAARRSARGCPNSRPKKSRFSTTDSVAIEILPQPLRHVGDARAHVAAMLARRPCRRRARARCLAGSCARRR